MISEQAILRLADDVTWQPMGQGQDNVILSLSSGYLYTCNETTADFLRTLDGQATLGEVIDRLGLIYEIDAPQLRADMLTLAKRFLDEKLLVEA